MLFASGRAAELILVVVLGEAIWLIVRKRPVAAVLLTLAPGAAMLAGLREALVGAAWYWVAIPLTVSFPLHLADLRHRRLI